MNSRIFIQSSALADLIAAGKMGRKIRALMPILLLAFSRMILSQAVVHSPTSQLASKTSTEASTTVRSNPESSKLLSPRERFQRAHLLATGHTALESAQTPAITAGQFTFVTINVPNAAFTQPNAVNNEGVVTGYYADANYEYHGFAWQSGTIQIIDYPGGTNTIFTAINNWGVLAGSYVDANYITHVVTYNLADSTWTTLPPLPNGFLYQSLNGINDEGLLAGCANLFGNLSWIWHPRSQSFSYFTVPPAGEGGTCAEAINDGQQVLGFYSDAYQSYLSPPLFFGSNGNYKSISLLTALSASYVSNVAGFNNRNQITGYYVPSAPPNNSSGFVLSPNGALITVNEPGYDDTYPAGINDFGVICGDVYDATTGASPGFIAYPVGRPIGQ